jgi:hypothetical protein
MNALVILSIVAALAITGPTMLYEVKLADATSKEFCAQVPGSEQNCFNSNKACKEFIKERNVDGKCVKQE